MAGGIQNNDNWFIKLVNTIKETSENKNLDVSTSDIINIFEKANSVTENKKDGIIDAKEFSTAISDYYGSNAFTDELSRLEDFTEAFDGICNFDGSDGLTYGDLSELNKMNYGGSDTANIRKTSSGKRTSFEAGIADAQKQRIKLAENHTDAVKPAEIKDDATLEELTAGRNETAKNLTEARTKLEEAENDKAVEEAQKGVDEAQEAFDEAVEKADEEAVKELKEQKAETDAAIADQKSTIDGLKGDISSTESEISKISGEISANAAKEPTQDRFMETDKDGNPRFNSNAFSAAHSAWQAKQKSLENEKARAEEKLADLNSQLIKAEDTLTSLEAEKEAIETEITEALKDSKDDVSELKDKLDAAKEKLEEAKEKAADNGQITADIAQLEANLIDYDFAIRDKLNEKARSASSSSSDKTESTSKADKADDDDEDAEKAASTKSKSDTTTTSTSKDTPQVKSDTIAVPNYTGGGYNGGGYNGGGYNGGGSGGGGVSGGKGGNNNNGIAQFINNDNNGVQRTSNTTVISSSEEQVAQRNAGRYGINVDGKIGASKQQTTGDCWALAGINSLSYSSAGRKIIDKAIDYKSDRAIVHTCFGDYTIMYSELQNAKSRVNYDENGNSVGNRYTVGDDDVVILELAIEKLRTDVKNKVYDLHSDDFIKDAAHDEYYRFSDTNALDGGLSGELIYYLTGNQAKETREYADRSAALDNLSKNPETTAVTGGFKQATVSDIYGNSVDLIEAHAYAIKSADDKTVTFTNPWDSGKDITLDRETFLAHNADLMTTDLSSVVKDQPSYPGVPEGFADYLRSRLNR